MSKAARKGIIVSYLAEQGYGFIKGADEDTSYFFKASECAFQPAAGKAVAFEAKATAKGLAAINIVVDNEVYEILRNPEQFLVTEQDGFREAEVIFEFAYPCFASAPLHDQARHALIAEAKKFGATGLINLRSYSIGKGIIQMEGQAVFVQTRGVTYDSAEADREMARVQSVIDLGAKLEVEYSEFINANIFHKLLSIVGGLKKALA